MKTKTVPSKWMQREGLRLDVGPYLSGALEARVRLEELAARKDKLADLTAGHNGGIYNGPKFSRTWVDDPKHGVPFVGSSAMLMADLSHLPLLRKKDATSSKLSYLEIKPGMTLISCSGTIGRMVYARPDMQGIWSSQHIMKVVPDPAKIPSGYLYAYLSSKFGVPLVVSGTYGAIIQHIEPHHIADLPVPRLGAPVEREVHELVKEAAAERAAASKHGAEAIELVERLLTWGDNEAPKDTEPTATMSTLVQRRMDAFHHSRGVVAARAALASSPFATRLGDVASEVFEPNRGSRMKVDDPAFGVPFLSSSQVFRLDPEGEYLVSRRRTPHLRRLLVSDRDLLLPRSGQLGGIIGRAVLPLSTYVGHAASEHLVRVRCASKADARLLWAIFASRPGYLAAVGTAYGSSIPSLDCALLAELQVPWWTGSERDSLVTAVDAMVDGRARAIVLERQAVATVESAIEEAT